MGSKVGSLYTATSLQLLDPVANRVLLGFISMLCIPDSWSGGTLFTLDWRLGIWSMCLVFTSSTISLLHLVPKMTCLWLSHWLQNTLLILFMFPRNTGYSFSMALLSKCLVAYSVASLCVWNLLSQPLSLLMMQSTKLQDML